MTTVYLANSFPEPVESYVWEEIQQLRCHGEVVFPASMRRPKQTASDGASFSGETQYAFPLQPVACLKANWLLLQNLWRIRDLIRRAIRGPESLSRKLRTLAHTWLGGYLAALLGAKDVRHIHVHHGYFSAWVGMIAARMLGASFSMTLHGSDLLVRADYLDAKLAECRFCFTISDFNRRHILANFQSIAPSQVLVQHLGVDVACWRPHSRFRSRNVFSILSVGRLHAVKNQGFLLLACHALKNGGVQFRCVIAGEGDERKSLEQLIRTLGLQENVTLLGQVPRQHLSTLYSEADVVVLTSHSEGVPVTLMEAMAMERIVIAPRISGIPEIVIDNENGFLYEANSMDDFLDKLRMVMRCGSYMDGIRHAARRQILSHFNARINLSDFAFRFLQQIASPQTQAVSETDLHENPILQQI
jgi:glycosyltransferase involved in cell wall biosynthesis